MKFVKKISLLAILMSAVFNLNALAQADAAEQIELKMVSRDDKSKTEITVDAKEAAAGSSDLITATTYAFSAQNGVALEDMSTGTTALVAPNVDDNASAVTNIGFEFWYDGARYTQFSCNANGVCRLGGSAVTTSFNNGTEFASTTNAPKIAPYYDDMWTGTNGGVRYKVVGAPGSRKLVVEWFNQQIPRVGAGNAGAGTFQMWLYESVHPTLPGVIQFVYGSGIVLNSANAGYSIGLQSGAATNFASVTTSTDTVSYTTANNTQTDAIPAGKSYVFTPLNNPAAPSGLTFGASTATTNTLNWTDNSSNEAGFAVYRSTDGTNFTFIAQTAANATSFTDTGLSPSTNYFYRVYAVGEGILNPDFISGNQTTTAPGNDTCSATPTLWSAPTSWADGTVPTNGDNVNIQAGCALTIDIAATALNLTVGGTLTYEAATARTLTVVQSVTVDAGGVFQTAATGTVTTHNLIVGTDLTNNGTLDFSTTATNVAGGTITFTGAANNTFGGTGAVTDVRTVTINKGTSNANVLELTATNFTVRGVNTDVAGYLTLTNGTFKISGTFTMANRTFITSTTYSINATAGIWLNNPNYTVSPTAASTSTANTGLFRLTQGTYNVGLTGADGLGGNAGAVFIFEGGTFNAPRFDPQNAVTFTMTGGTINIGVPAANSRSNFGSFELFSTSSIFNMSGGTINLVRASTGGTPIDWQVRSGTVNITGGTLNVGTAATPAAANFRATGVFPNINVDNTTNTKTLTFITGTSFVVGNVTVNAGSTYALNGFPVVHQGTSFVNNGTITGSTAGSRLYFASGAPFTFSGTGVTGTTAAPIAAVDFDGPGGVTFDAGLANNVITNIVRLFQGNVTNTNKITLGSGGASASTVQVGLPTTPSAAGAFDQPFTFNLGTGGQTLLYLRTTGNRTTGTEINPARVLTGLTFDDNTAGRTLTVAGGNLTVTGGLTLTNGVIVTSLANTLIHNGAATRTNGFVDGPMVRDFTVAPVTAYTFHVGEGVYSPVALANITAANSALSVEAINQTLTPFLAADAISRNWSLNKTGAGTLTADVTFTYDQTDDVQAGNDETDFRLYRRDTANPTEVCGVACVDETANTATVTGLSSFSRWTIAEALAPLAASINIAGRVVSANGVSGLPKVNVTLTGGRLAQPITVTTSPFGYYSFESLEAGQTYILTVGAKQVTFTVPTRVITADSDITNLDFIANP